MMAAGDIKEKKKKETPVQLVPKKGKRRISLRKIACEGSDNLTRRRGCRVEGEERQDGTSEGL